MKKEILAGGVYTVLVQAAPVYIGPPKLTVLRSVKDGTYDGSINPNAYPVVVTVEQRKVILIVVVVLGTIVASFAEE
jgi:hypothetical protein